jgi:hypothetical protein
MKNTKESSIMACFSKPLLHGTKRKVFNIGDLLMVRFFCFFWGLTGVVFEWGVKG